MEINWWAMTISQNENPQELVNKLVELLAMERIDSNIYRGPITNEPQIRVFGGQVIGQALMAACRTVDEDRMPHSLHAYFMRPGNPKEPIVYEVFRDRDGKSFSSRRVVAMQDGAPILNMSCSFQAAEEGISHQSPMPNVIGPELLKNESQLVRDNPELFSEPRHTMRMRLRPIEFRPVSGIDHYIAKKRDPIQYFWFRAAGTIPQNQIMHRVLLAYASDMMLLSTALLPHGINWDMPQVQVASLDHAVWFHDNFDMGEWLLYALESPWAGGSRGLSHGKVYTQDGRLVASVAQEGLNRVFAAK